MSETREITEDERREGMSDDGRNSTEQRSLEKLFNLVEGEGALLTAIQQIKSEIYRLSEKIPAESKDDGAKALATLEKRFDPLEKSLEGLANLLHHQHT